MLNRVIGLTSLVCWALVVYFAVMAGLLDRDVNGDRYELLVVGFGVLAGACAVPGIILGLVFLHVRDQELIRRSEASKTS